MWDSVSRELRGGALHGAAALSEYSPTISELIPTVLGDLKPLTTGKTDVTATHAVGHEYQVLVARLLAARQETDAIFDGVRPEAMFDRPIPERHRVIFYVGHLEAFDWNCCAEAVRAASPMRSWIGCLPSASIR